MTSFAIGTDSIGCISSQTLRNKPSLNGIETQFNLRKGGVPMGRYLLLWLIGVPLPILALIYAFGGLH
jgi:hypothetical protein